jgi:hypothetical protein
MVLDQIGKGVHVQFIKENLTFTGEDSPMSNLLLNLLGAVAEFESLPGSARGKALATLRLPGVNDPLGKMGSRSEQ